MDLIHFILFLLTVAAFYLGRYTFWKYKSKNLRKTEQSKELESTIKNGVDSTKVQKSN